MNTDLHESNSSPSASIRDLALLVAVALCTTFCVVAPAGAQTTNGVSLVAAGFSGDMTLTLAPWKALHISDSAVGTVYRLTTDGSVVTEATGFTSPRGMIFDGAGNLYVADAAAGKVYRLDTNGETTLLAENLNGPCCLGFDGEGNLLVAHAASGDAAYNGAITRITPTGDRQLVASGFSNMHGLVVDDDGNVLIAAEGFIDSRGSDIPVATGSGLYRIDELGQVTRLVDLGSITPFGLTLSGQGSLFFSGAVQEDGTVFVSSGGIFEPFVTGLGHPRALAADAKSLYVADEAAGEVWRVPFRPTTGSTETAEQKTLEVAVPSAPPSLKNTAGGTGTASSDGAGTRFVPSSIGLIAGLSAATSGETNGCPRTMDSSPPDEGMALMEAGDGGDPNCVPCSSGWCREPAPVSPQPPNPKDGEPVDVQTGIFQMERTDLVVPGLMPIVFKHIYRSADSSKGRLGIGATHSYDYRVWHSGGVEPPTIWFMLPTNTRYRFERQADGSYINTNIFWLAGAKLYDSGVTGEGRYGMRFKDGTILSFRSENGYLSLIRDPNRNQLRFTYHTYNSHLLAEISQPGGRSLHLEYKDNYVSRVTDNSGRSVSYVYDAADPPHLLAATNAMGGVTSYTYTNNDLTTITLPNGVEFLQNIYDANNRVATQILADAGTFSFTYHTNSVSGVVTQTVVRNPLGNPTTYNFNEAGFNTRIGDALGNTNAFIRDPDNGQVVQVIDTLSRTNSFVYDAVGNVTAITNAQNKVTRFTYEPTFNRLTSVIDPLGRTNSFGYDAYGNLTSITNALGKVTRMTYNELGLPTTVTDPLSNTYTFSYNETLDLATVTDPLGNQVSRLVDTAGRPYALIDPFGRTTRINYDALNRVSSIQDPISGLTGFGYDSVGNLTNVTDALSHTVSYGYDAMNQLTNRADQLGQFEVYRYDKNGNVTNFVDRRGVSIDFKYDLLDRRTSVVYGAESSVRYFYDNAVRLTNINDSIAGNIGLTYDSLDRLMQETNVNGVVNYLYNDVGLRTNMTVVGETPVSYLYDTANRLTNAVQGTLTSSLFYDDAGRRTKLILPSGISVLYFYDTGSRLTNITYQAAATNKIDYTYDEVGNRSSQSSALANYLLPLAVTNSTYDAANHQLVFGSYNILYDDNGNVTNIVSGTTTNNLVWSARNQLTNMTGAVTAFFLYDGLGRRITRNVSSNIERYHHDGLDIMLQRTSSGAIGARYFRGLAIDEPWQRSDVGAMTTNRIYLADALGSIVALADTNMVIQTEYDYEPFGATTNTGAGNKNTYKFTGREEDGTGLYYYRARYYHPALSRFVSEDPLRFRAGDVNVYRYAYDNAVRFFDPMGTEGLFDGFRRSVDQIYSDPSLSNDVGDIVSMPAKVLKNDPFLGNTYGKAANGERVTPLDVVKTIPDMVSKTGPGILASVGDLPAGSINIPGAIGTGLQTIDEMTGYESGRPLPNDYITSLLGEYLGSGGDLYSSYVDWSNLGVNVVDHISGFVLPARTDGASTKRDSR